MYLLLFKPRDDGKSEHQNQEGFIYSYNDSAFIVMS